MVLVAVATVLASMLVMAGPGPTVVASSMLVAGMAGTRMVAGMAGTRMVLAGLVVTGSKLVVTGSKAMLLVSGSSHRRPVGSKAVLANMLVLVLV